MFQTWNHCLNIIKISKKTCVSKFVSKEVSIICYFLYPSIEILHPGEVRAKDEEAPQVICNHK